MFSKIALNNVKKSIRDYTIYFLTLTFAICIFYTFNSIESQKAILEMGMGQASYIELLVKIISIISVFIAFVLGGLIIYATNFLIKKRKKEFGIYMSLGMSKRKISTILFVETLIIGSVSLIIGLLLGILASQGLSVITSKLFEMEMSEYTFVLSADSIIKTILYFGVMYLVVMLFNTRAISKYKLIDLLSANKKSENIKMRNQKFAVIILILSFVLLAVAYYFISISNLNFEEKPFWIAIACGIIGTALFFYGIATVVFYFIISKKNLYLNNLTVFNTRQIISKFNTNTMSMTVICLMLFFTMSSLSLGLSMKVSMEAQLEKNTPFDATVTVFNRYDEDKEMLDIKEIFKKNGYDIEDKSDNLTYNYYLIDVNVREALSPYALTETKEILKDKMYEQSLAVSLSDYNKIREMKGLDKLELNKDEVSILAGIPISTDLAQKYLQDNDKIKIGDKSYMVKDRTYIEESLKTSTSAGEYFTLIAPDEVLKGKEPAKTYINMDLKNESKEEYKKLESLVDENGRKVFDNGRRAMSIETRRSVSNEHKGISAIMVYISVYIGVIFLLSSATVLALQQLSECSESIDRYIAIKKIGATERMINKSVFKQISVFFGLPLLLAIVHSIVAIIVVNDYIKQLKPISVINMAMYTAIIIIVVYGGYFYSTYVAYKNYIND